MTRRVLIVDDEANIRRMMQLTLEADGYDVEDAADGATALEQFGDGSRFDAVVLDQKMPGMDGIETLRQMLTRAPGARIIMATAFASIELAVDAMKAGARDFLKKPLTPALLRDAVAAALSKPRPEEAPQPQPAPAAPSVDGAHESWTVNGFFIRALPPTEPMSAFEHHFVVRHARRGPQGDVTVAIAPAEAARITKLSGRPVPPSRGFWQQQAERALMNHLFQNSALPAGNHLTVGLLSDEVVLQAREWKDV
jgi:CheY-like chemotaxis protein